jgi:hypothetical protein
VFDREKRQQGPNQLLIGSPKDCVVTFVPVKSPGYVITELGKKSYLGAREWKDDWTN